MLADLGDDFADPQQQKKRYSRSNDELAAEERRQEEESLRGLGAKAWEIIEQWGRQTDLLTPHKRGKCTDIALSISKNRPLTDSELENGRGIIDLMLDRNPQLLDELYAEQPATAVTSAAPRRIITLDDAEHLLIWEKKNKKLRAADADFLVKVRKGELRFSEAVKGKVFYLQNSVLRHGYKLPELETT
jgi:hypothetical protein